MSGKPTDSGRREFRKQAEGVLTAGERRSRSKRRKWWSRETAVLTNRELILQNALTDLRMILLE